MTAPQHLLARRGDLNFVTIPLSVDTSKVEERDGNLFNWDLRPDWQSADYRTIAGRDIQAKLGIRPQYLSIVEGLVGGVLPGRVALVERLGTETVVGVELTSGGRIVAALSEDRPLAVGSDGALSFDPAQAHLFC